MTLLSCIIIQIIWAFCAKGQVRPCDKPLIENGALTDYYSNYEERVFPAQLGSTIYYRCLNGYVSTSEEKWNLIRCNREGWNPMPKCLRKCLRRNFENGELRYSYWKTYKEGDETSYVCYDEYSPENQQNKVTCTKNGWSPTPRCIFNKICEKSEIQNGYFYENKERFNFNENTLYRCQIGYTTPEGNETGKTQCLPEGWSPVPKCIKSCKRPTFENINFPTNKMVFLPKEILEYECADGYQTVNKMTTGQTECGINGWTSEPQCLAPACEEPPVIDFGVIVSGEKLEYRESDKVKYKCDPGFSLIGSEWITCSRKTWMPAPQCLAPCSITKQQLEAKNLLLSSGRRHAQLIQSDHTLRFMCSEGYALTIPSVRKCVSGHMDLPSCISERGKNCSHPPTIENGDITTFLEKEYTSGSYVEFKCQKFYAMEGQNISFCDNGNWTKAPLCLEPCAISVEEMENQMVELNARINENILRSVYIEHGDFLELRCKSGYALATNLSQSTFMVECNGNPIVYPECKEIVCDPPGVVNGSFRPQRNKYRDGDIIIIACNHGFHSHNGHNTAECTKNGWLPTPRCSNTQD